MALLAEQVDDVGEIALGCLRDDVGGARPVAAHAHVERAVEAEREAALGLVELHRRDADVEHDAVDRRRSRRRARRVERGEASSTSVSRPSAAATRSTPRAIALWSRSMPMTRASAAARWRACSRRRRTCRRYRRRRRERSGMSSAGPREHGNVTGRSASDSRSRRRRPSSFPCSERIFRRSSKPSRFLQRAPSRWLPRVRAEKRTGSQIAKVRPARMRARPGQCCIGLFNSIGYVPPSGIVWLDIGGIGERTGQTSNGSATRDPNHRRY